jgi:hypothetical protein
MRKPDDAVARLLGIEAKAVGPVTTSGFVLLISDNAHKILRLIAAAQLLAHSDGVNSSLHLTGTRNTYSKSTKRPYSVLDLRNVLRFFDSGATQRLRNHLRRA